MSMRKVASQVCKLEGKKSQVAVGDMHESLNFLCLIIAKEEIDNTDGSPSPTLFELRKKIESIKAKVFGKKK